MHLIIDYVNLKRWTGALESAVGTSVMKTLLESQKGILRVKSLQLRCLKDKECTRTTKLQFERQGVQCLNGRSCSEPSKKSNQGGIKNNWTEILGQEGSYDMQDSAISAYMFSFLKKVAKVNLEVTNPLHVLTLSTKFLTGVMTLVLGNHVDDNELLPTEQKALRGRRDCQDVLMAHSMAVQEAEVK